MVDGENKVKDEGLVDTVFLERVQVVHMQARINLDIAWCIA